MAPCTPKKQLTLPLKRRESMGSAYHVLSFDSPEEMNVLPGQFLMLRGAEWGDAPLLGRPMSFLSGGRSPSVLIKVVGDGTRRMARAEPGEPFDLVGPLGKAWARPTPGQRPLLVAGGVGIAPLLFLARTLAAHNPLAVYGGRSQNDLPLEDALAEVAEVILTTEDGSVGTQGRVTDVLDDLLTQTVEVYTCGPDRMMAAVAERCAQRELTCHASLETPMACGYGVCLGCPVKRQQGGYLYACVDGPCINAQEIDWTAGGHAPDPGRSTANRT